MSDYEQSGPRYRRIAPESDQEDTRNLFELYRDTIRTSPSGEPFFTAREQDRVTTLETNEVLVEAQAITVGSAALWATSALQGVTQC